MTALGNELMTSEENWYRQVFPLRSGKKAWKGGFAIGNPVSADVVPGVASASQVFLGRFAETIDNTNGSGPTGILVNLLKERTLIWCANDASITGANLFQNAYINDDQSVGLTSSAHTLLGVIMAVSTTDGVLVQISV